MFSVDVNCDMGEGVGSEELILPYISSANIACGYHAGDIVTMRNTADLCIKYNVAIGAHPSFADKKNFGRSEMTFSDNEVYDLIMHQLTSLSQIVKERGVCMHHVKPHGALYNMSAKNRTLAATIASAIKDFDSNLILYGLSGSVSITEAQKIGLRTYSEVFADRTYQDNGMLTGRSQPQAFIDSSLKAAEQVLRMIKQKTVLSVSGYAISIQAETVCIHSDGMYAVDFARAIYLVLKENSIIIKA